MSYSDIPHASSRPDTQPVIPQPGGPGLGGLSADLERGPTEIRTPVSSGPAPGEMTLPTSTTDVVQGVAPSPPLPEIVRASVGQFLTANPFGNVFTHLAATFPREGFFAVNRALLELTVASFPPPAQATLARAQQIAAGAVKMQADGYSESFVSSVSRHRLGLYLSGVTALFPRQCLPRSEHDRVNGILRDENGHEFDSFRESRRPPAPDLTQAFSDYVSSNGGDYDLIDRWADDQAEGSWQPRAMAMKWLTLKEKYPDPSMLEQRFFWGPTGMGDVQAKYLRFLASNPEEERSSIETWAMQRAFMMEIFSSIQFPGSTRDGNVVIFRTEDQRVIATNNLKPGVPSDYKKGPFESCSLMSLVHQGGNQTVAFVVPPHRIGGLYCFSRSGSQTGCFFLRDSENEVLVSLEGLPGTYLGSMQESDMVQRMEQFKQQNGVL